MDDNEEYYEHENYRQMLEMQPDEFYLHLPLELPFLKWFFELRLQLLLQMNQSYNYFGMRHRFDPEAMWFSDWVFLNHYQIDYQQRKNWKPSIADKIRYQWLMLQGYRKEQKYFLALNNRKESKQVSVKERKFLEKYIQCRYWSYLNAAEDDRLAFFRMGIDTDEQLNDEDKPLFPNIAYTYPNAPMLAYFIGGTMQTESIPPNQSWWDKRKAKKKILKKWSKTEKVTYADMRILFNPDTIKIHDLEFLLHCYDTYGGEPKDKDEKALFEHLYPMYELELTHVAQMMHMPELDKLTAAKNRKELNPLYVAYKQRWFNVNPVKEFEKVFHGVTENEYQEIVNKQYKKFEKTNRPKHQKKQTKTEIKKLNDLLGKLQRTK